MSEGLLTYQDVANRWSVSVRTVRRLVARKKLSAVRIGHSTVKFRPADVERAEQKLSTKALV